MFDPEKNGKLNILYGTFKLLQPKKNLILNQTLLGCER